MYNSNGTRKVVHPQKRGRDARIHRDRFDRMVRTAKRLGDEQLEHLAWVTTELKTRLVYLAEMLKREIILRFKKKRGVFLVCFPVGRREVWQAFPN